MRAFLAKGAHSNVYIDDVEPGVVIKENTDIKNNSDWIVRQKRGYEIINCIKKYNTDTGVLLPELLGIEKIGDKQIIKETVLPGRVFDDGDMYYSLPESVKNNIAKQMAVFLNAMHSSYECNSPKDSIKNMFVNYFKVLNNADGIISKFDGKLPECICNRLKIAEQYILKCDISDEVMVMTHGDLRINNIMYDENTEKLVVIDFELAKFDNVYHDFIAFCPGSSMPWDFTKRVINFYNKIPNKKYSITINSEKVQNVLFYGAMHEYACCIKPGDNEWATEKRFDIIKWNLKRVTGIDVSLDKKTDFENGIKKFPKNNHHNIPNLDRDM